MIFLLSCVIKVSVILIAALCGGRMLRRQSAAIRHWVLFAGIVSAGILPGLSLVIPSWDLSIRYVSKPLPTRSTGASQNIFPAEKEGVIAAPDNAAPRVIKPGREGLVVPGISHQVEGIPAVPNGVPLVFQTSDPATVPSRPSGFWMPSLSLNMVVWVWGFGALAALALLGVGTMRLAWIAMGSRVLTEGPWVMLAAEIGESYGLRRPARVLQSRSVSLLVTWGSRRPTILLPWGAETWPEQRIRAVLFHELAHARRRDWAAQTTAELLRAIYWFNPLFSLTCSRLRRESEQASDDAALRGGIPGPEYAAHLLDVVRSLRHPGRGWSHALSMARRSGLEQRFAALLNPDLNRREATRRPIAATLIAFAALTLPVSALRATAPAAPETVSAVTPAAPIIAAPQSQHSTAGALGVFQSLQTALLALVGQRPPEQPDTSKASIEGVVYRAGGNEPLAGARVMLVRTGQSRGPGSALQVAGSRGAGPSDPRTQEELRVKLEESERQFQDFARSAGLLLVSDSNMPEPRPTQTPSGGAVSADTGADGKFVLKGIDPGSYRLAVVASGYARQEYGQRALVGRGIEIALTSGQAMNDIVMRLTPAGNVSGHIRNPFGQPLSGIEVQFVRYTYDSMGQRSFQTVGAATTNDRGEYRAYWLTPGRYYVGAGVSPGTLRGLSPGGGANSNELQDNYTYTYFPGVTELNAAIVIDVQPGSELGAIDLVLARQRSYRIRGRIIDSRTGQPPSAATIAISYRNSLGQNISASGGQSFNPASGTFEVVDVGPGSYVITATISDPSAIPTVGLSPTLAAGLWRGPYQSSNIAVNVADSDVDGVALTVTPGVTVPGRVSVDAPAPTRTPGNLNGVRLRLRASVDGVPTFISASDSPISQPSNADGIFVVESVTSGEYRVYATGLPEGFYVKEVRYNQADILNRPLQLSAADPGRFEVVLSPNSGQVDGVVTDERNQPFLGAQVVLIPERSRERSELYRKVFTDQNGRFSITGVSPGDYRLLDWEGLEPYMYFDPEIAKQFEQRGRFVHVSELSRVSVDLRMIPAGGQ